MTSNLLEKPELENGSQDGWAVTCDLKIINPGVVHYDDLKNSAGELLGGEILADKDFLDHIAPTLEGKPIVNWDHRKVSAKEFDRGSFQGIITSRAMFNKKWNQATETWVDSDDGYYHARASIWNKATLNNIERGHSISCAYVVNDWRGPGEHNKVPYANAADKGVYTHIAVVSVPRYEGARIEILNSVKGGVMGMLSFFRKDKPEEKVEIDTTAMKIDGVAVSEMLNSYKEKKAREASASLQPKDDDLFDDGMGGKVSLKELKNAHKEDLQNSMSAEHEDGKHKGEKKENCSMCNSADEKDKEEKERKNAADEEEKKRKEDEERKNSASVSAKKEADEKAAAAKRAATLDEARNKGQKLEMPPVQTLAALMAEGESRYGVDPQVKK